jgi:hypothetical protein
MSAVEGKADEGRASSHLNGRTSPLGHPGHAHALIGALSPREICRMVTQDMVRKRRMVKFGSSASPSCTTVRAWFNSPSRANAAARLKCAMEQFRLASRPRRNQATSSVMQSASGFGDSLAIAVALTGKEHPGNGVPFSLECAGEFVRFADAKTAHNGGCHESVRPRTDMYSSFAVLPC